MQQTYDQAENLAQINEEIERQLLEELENPPVEKKKRRAIYSFTGLVSLFALARLLYAIIHLYFT